MVAFDNEKMFCHPTIPTIPWPIHFVFTLLVPGSVTVRSQCHQESHSSQLEYSLDGTDEMRGSHVEMQGEGKRQALPVPGLFIEYDYISASHERELIRIFKEQLTWPCRSGRLALHYGHTFDYKTMGIDKDVAYIPFPDWLVPLLPRSEDDEQETTQINTHHAEDERTEAYNQSTEQIQGRQYRQNDCGQREGRYPDQVCLQYYAPGTGIPPHADTHSVYSDTLLSLSLGTPLLMDFRRTCTNAPDTHGHASNGHQHGSMDKVRPHVAAEGGAVRSGLGSGLESHSVKSAVVHSELDVRVEVDLVPRSMLTLSGAARLHYTHGIKKRKRDIIRGPGPQGSTHANAVASANCSAPGARSALIFDHSSTASCNDNDNDNGGENDNVNGNGCFDGPGTTGTGSKSNESHRYALGETKPGDQEREQEWERPRGERWSVTFRWLRTRTRHGQRSGDTHTNNDEDDGEDEDAGATVENGEATKLSRPECYCGDAKLCDSELKRNGTEKVFRWKEAVVAPEA